MSEDFFLKENKPLCDNSKSSNNKMQCDCTDDVKQCFELFASHIRNTTKKNIPEYDIDNMNIQDIIIQTNIIYMQYILSNSFSISTTSIPVIAFDHLKKIINEYCDNGLYVLFYENKKLKQEIYNLKNIRSNEESVKLSKNVESIEEINKSFQSPEIVKESISPPELNYDMGQLNAIDNSIQLDPNNKKTGWSFFS